MTQGPKPKGPTWRSIPLRRWPEAERAAWLTNTDRSQRHRRPKATNRFAEASLFKFQQGYGRWLGFLAHRGWLDPVPRPGDRITGERLNAYFEALQQAGNADYTIVGRFIELSRAMAILEPGKDWRWVRGPRGGVIPHGLRTKRPILVPHSKVLFRWGQRLMDKAAAPGAAPVDAAQFRDGLAIAIGAARARRLRSISALQLGTELFRQPDGRWRISLPSGRVKTRIPDSVHLPAALTPYIDRYLAEVRPFLLRGRVSTAVWIADTGKDMSAAIYAENYGKRAHERFGVRFGPHRNRHAAATTAAIEVSSDPTLAARMLGITRHVLDDSYNRAGQTAAAQHFNGLIETLQKEAIVRAGYRKPRPRLRSPELGGRE